MRCVKQRARFLKRLISLTINQTLMLTHNNRILKLFVVLVSWRLWAVTPLEVPDEPCVGYEAWQVQSNVRSSSDGHSNVAYPEANATYWAMSLRGPVGTTAVIHGRYPKARYMAVQVYDSERNVLGAIGDAEMEPDPGENNPFRTGFDQGTYTVRVIIGRSLHVAANTIYTAGRTDVLILYRIYHSNDPNDLTGATFDPELPSVTIDGRLLSTCPPRPIIVPEDLTVWGRLDNADYAGTPPAEPSPAALNPPLWNLEVTDRRTPYYPNADNSYMTALISRRYLTPPFNYDLVVFRFKAPTFANTQAGEPPYLATTDREMRFWSVCQNEPLSTSVVRCVPDSGAASLNGYVSFVISDPSRRPTDEVLRQHGATWLPWGALSPGDSIYNINGNLLDNSTNAYYYGAIIYRQTSPNPNFGQSFAKIAELPRNTWKSAMGEYWPSIGYCTSAQFEAAGPGCIP